MKKLKEMLTNMSPTARYLWNYSAALAVAIVTGAWFSATNASAAASSELEAAVTLAKNDAIANINAAIPILAVLFALIISIYVIKRMVKSWSK